MQHFSRRHDVTVLNHSGHPPPTLKTLQLAIDRHRPSLRGEQPVDTDGRGNDSSPSIHLSNAAHRRPLEVIRFVTCYQKKIKPTGIRRDKSLSKTAALKISYDSCKMLFRLRRKPHHSGRVQFFCVIIKSTPRESNSPMGRMTHGRLLEG